MQVNDFYLLAAIIADFELREGNRLKNEENQKYGFDYFNNDSINKFK
ncbi:MAG: hypothetical protein PHX40_01880 [Bacilli bacterium]|nr:hypothetical protein [Bacilli bacterium]